MDLLEGRVLGVLENPDGEVSGSTTFHFHEQDSVVSANYAGGAVRLGYLVGTRDGTQLRFRYVHLSADGELSSGISDDRIEVLADGRVRLYEKWRWESKDGSGESILEEVRDPDRRIHASGISGAS